MPSAKTHNSLIRAAKRNDLVAIRKLIENGANVNGEDIQGWTPLFHAAHRGDIHAIDVLIQSGAEVNHGKETGFTALFSAVLGGHLDAVRMLLRAGAEILPVQGVQLRGYARGKHLKAIIAILSETSETRLKSSVIEVSKETV